MSGVPPTEPLPQPASPAGVPAGLVMSGPLVLPTERIRLFSPKQWEEFVHEWADSLRSRYASVERLGGAGDKGLDIIARCKEDGNVWDYFQCKHYKEPLQPSHIWVELGKLVYYTRRGDYSYPRRYSFAAPQGPGTKLSNLLRNPTRLRDELLANWSTYCRTSIRNGAPIDLDGPLRAYVAGLDFSIFNAIPPLRLVDEHAQTRWHVARFGGGLPPRPRAPDPPADIGQEEANYVRRLLEAYADHLERSVEAIADLGGRGDLREHFDDSRREFYSAESLRTFSRDTLPPGEFETLQDEIHDGIKDEVRREHEDGYRRVVEVVKVARLLPLSAPALCSRLSVRDRGGICHQLANDQKVKWIK